MKKIRIKKTFSLLFNIVIILLLSFTVKINDDFNFIIDKKVIKSDFTYKKYKDYKFVSFDLSKAEESRFVLKKKENYKVYTIKYNNKEILLILNNGTVITDDVNLMYMNETMESMDLKESLVFDDNSLKFIDGYYTNINLKENIDMIKIKLYITYLLIILLCALSVIDIMVFINPKLSRKYKKDTI